MIKRLVKMKTGKGENKKEENNRNKKFYEILTEILKTGKTGCEKTE